MRILAGLAVTLAAVGFGPTSRAAVVVNFDPNGTGGATNLAIVSFDESPGNALAVGSILAPGVPNTVTPFTVLYQARIGTLNDAGNNIVSVPGLTTTGELTIVAMFKEVETVTGPNSVTLSLNTPQVGSFIQVYFDPSKDSSDLAGTGFNNGTLIYSGTVNRDGTGSFANTPGAIDNFDNHLANDYPGVLSLVGAGGTILSANTTFQNSNFFLTSVSMLQFSFNTSNKVPFAEVDPSHLFFNGTVPVLGPPGLTINGLTGPDFQFQADANSSFQTAAVPEPATVSGALVGIGLIALRAFRARRRQTA